MSQLANNTERKAIKVLANTLRFFGNTTPLFMSAEDAFEARQAENTLRGIIEKNGYKVHYQKGKGTRLLKHKIQHYDNELF